MKLVIVKLMFKFAVGRWKEEIFWTWMMGNKIQERVSSGCIEYGLFNTVSLPNVGSYLQ
jgi:hypothetical protein